MNAIKNLVEYYDELFPISEAKKSFYQDISKNSKTPVHFLSVNCGTGFLESSLARQGHDVTGIENEEELLQTANLRRRSQLMSIRFFQMQIPDMSKFLGKSFYNVISVLNSRIMFFPGPQAIRNFFSDCKKLLALQGVLVLELINFDAHQHDMMFQLKTRESVRSKLFTEIFKAEDGSSMISANVENSSEKLLPVLKDVPVYPLTPAEIEHFAEEAGFTNAEFYADFDKTPFTGNEESFVVMVS
ncbi:MAG: methyltransferase domain-containing protein [Treponema sp.]|nr:methyltransferase domain-containing protein [Candidatus Treponema equi]